MYFINLRQKRDRSYLPGIYHFITFITHKLQKHFGQNILFNPLMPGGNNKGHTYLNKPAAENCRFVEVCVTFLLPPGIKGLKVSNAF